MAYDEDLAQRVRERLAAHAAFEERKMFGGLVFMVNTHLACGVTHGDLLVRVGRGEFDAALAAGARVMDHTGRPMRSMVVVDGPRLVDPQVLERWVGQAAGYALAQPPKPPKPPKR